MISGNLKNLCSDTYYPKVVFDTLLKLKDMDLENLEPGRIELDGDNLFINVQCEPGKNLSDCRVEAHKEYIDIQLLIKGEESIGVALLDDNAVIEDPYDSSKDVAFYKSVNNEVIIPLKEYDFLVFFPNDLHRPFIGNENNDTLKKLIVKIHKSLF